MAGSTGRHTADRRVALLWALLLVALLAVALFDLQTALPISDEYARRWTIERLVAGHGLVLLGFSPNLLQTVEALPLALAGVDPRVWRLVLLPWPLVQGYFSWRLAVRLGASPFWAAVGAVCLTLTPLTLFLLTGFMTEVAFWAAWSALAYLAVVAVDEDRGWSACTAVVGLAVLQRQQAIAVVPILSAWFLFKRREIRDWRGDSRRLAPVWLAGVGAFAVDYFVHLAPSAPGGFATPHFTWVGAVAVTLLNAPTQLGLLLLPFALALLARREAPRRSVWEWVPAVVCGVALTYQVYVLATQQALIGYGLNPSHPWTDTSPAPRILQLMAEVGALASAFILFFHRRDLWAPRTLAGARGLLVLMALSQVAVIVGERVVLDRYFLAVAIPLVPIVAAAASRSGGVRHAPVVAIGVLVAGLLTFLPAEQDFIAWLQARDLAARRAYAAASPWQVEAGFEADARYVWLPAKDDPTGALPGFVESPPRYVLLTVPRSDPRPGVEYDSLTPGKVIIVPYR